MARCKIWNDLHFCCRVLKYFTLLCNVFNRPNGFVHCFVRLWNGVVPERCRQLYKRGEEWQCFFGHKLYSTLTCELSSLFYWISKQYFRFKIFKSHVQIELKTVLLRWGMCADGKTTVACQVQHVGLGILSLETRNYFVFVTQEWVVYIYRGSGTSSTESALLHCHVSTVSQSE